MNSDRTRRRDGQTLAKRWKMKHRNRKDDIPNCPSIEEIFNSISSIENKPTSARANTQTDAMLTYTVTPRNRRHFDDNRRSKRSKRKRSHRIDHVHTPRREKGFVHSDKHYRRYYSCPTSPSDLAVRCTTSERHDDIPFCPSMDEILDIDEAEINDDGEALRRFSTAFYQLIEDFCSLLLRAIDFSKRHPRPTAILGLIFVSYIIILYLELSFAAIFEIIVQSVWPAVKASVVVAERFSLSVAAAMDSFEDIFQGAYCDMAELWCKHFHMMCSDRCSFFEMALERMRKTTPG